MNICSSEGLRLCFEYELNTCCGTGCGYDDTMNWVKDSFHSVSVGCPRTYPDTPFSQELGDSKHIVRCCSPNGDTCTSEPCLDGDITYNEAVDVCSSRGSRLCFEYELNKCCGTGCNYDDATSWVADEEQGTEYNGFIKKPNTYCKDEGKEGVYTTLELAITACKESETCQSIYDYKCDGKNFKKCNEVENIKRKETSDSCIYRKTGKSYYEAYNSYNY